MKYLLFAFSVIIIFYSCSNKGQNEIANNTNVQIDYSEAESLMKQNCYACHDAVTPMENRLAPPMVAIRSHYLNDGLTEQEFITTIAEYIKNPTEEKSVMPGAVEKFGVMPKMVFDDEVINKIAAYLYNNEPEEPEWFKEHQKEEQGKRMGKGKGYLPNGKKIALQTKKVLGQNLMNAINAHGTVAAVEFCSTRAIPLTDSMALALNAKVKRVSDLNRNPNNAANESEINYINFVKEELKKGNDPSPKMQVINGKHVGYYPITTNQMCLQCHGTPNEQIKAETLAKINSIYPNDKAIGYSENELRGIWVVEMD